MRKFFAVLAFFAFVNVVSYAQAVMTFESTEIDYGTIQQGSDKVRHFKFKNTGNEPLTITNAKGSCGCTVPTWPKEPILPGQSSTIEVTYDTNRVGNFSKSITLTSNEANPTRMLTIKGVVLKNEDVSVPANSTGNFLNQKN